MLSKCLVSSGWQDIRFLEFTLKGIGLFDREWDSQERQPVLQHLLSTSFLLDELVHLRCLLEGRIKPGKGEINCLAKARFKGLLLK